MKTSCPTCEEPLVVPQLASLHDRSYGGDVAEDPLRSAFPAVEETVPASEAQDLRDELAEAQRLVAEQAGALAATRKESARLQQQLEKATAECAEQTANATAVLVEAQRLQAERQQLRSELADSQQRAATAEAHLGEARARVEQLVAGLELVEKDRLEWGVALRQTKENASATEAQLAARETELREARDQLAASENALASAREEAAALAGQRGELQRQIEAAQPQLQEAAATRAALATAEEKLAAAHLALTTTQTERDALSAECVALRREVKVLRLDLSEIHTGRELLALRDSFQALETEHRGTVATLARAEAELQALTNSEQKLRAEVTEARERTAAAERRAEAASDSSLQSDNGVLRGIINRQNIVLEERFVELRRLKRARLALRIVYALIALGLLAFVVLTFDDLPAVVKNLLHE